MTYFSHLRVGLISSVLLLTTALASPALAETLPEISPRQIASDVEVKFNPTTGAREFVAPSFDPFEEDRSMAGTASLRSVDSAVTIDGQSIRGGALLDMTFYYNSASNDPYDTRGYDEAVYLSGEYAPVTLRDNRILECNEQVQDVVYYHEDYYRPSLYINLFRPYRHYSGHYRYDRFRDRGYGYGRGYRGHRGYGTTRRGRIINHDRRRSRDRGGFADRAIDRRGRDDRGTRDRVRRDRNSDRATDRRGDRARDRAITERNRARNERVATGRRLDRTPAARDANRTRIRTDRANRSSRSETRRGGRDGFMGGPRRLENNEARRENRATRRANRNDQTRATRPRAERTRTERAPRVTPAPRAAAPTRRAAPAPRTERAAPAPRPQRTERSAPARSERAVNRAAQRDKSRNAPRARGGSNGKRGTKLKLMSFLPMASSWSRHAVRNVDVQCAREEILTVHIPQDRLDAARFDGLTVLVLDRSGQEVPVYVPPNYIEGFRQAVEGRAAPATSYQEPRRSEPLTSGPIYQEPRPYKIETAPCPVGTTQQSDGTCLQGGSPVYGGYPTR